MIREVIPQLTALVVYGVGGAIAPTLFTLFERCNFTIKSARYLLGFLVAVWWGAIFLTITEMAFNGITTIYGFMVYAVSTILFTVAENYEKHIFEPRAKKARKVKVKPKKDGTEPPCENKKHSAFATKNRVPKFKFLSTLKWNQNRRCVPQSRRRHK